MPAPAAVPEAAVAKPAEPELDSTAALKKATANLKAVTGVIPHEAILKKTAVIAEGLLTPQQAQASKTKTSRIALDSAIGVAPVNSSSPLKTIRLKRPAGLSASPAAAPAAAPAAGPAAAEPASDITQKKTLKLQRPGGAALKRPTIGAPKKPLGISKPAAPAAAGGDDVPTLEPVGDIPDISAVKPIAAAPAAGGGEGPKFLTMISLVVSIAALVILGLTTWMLWSEVAGTDDPNRFGVTAEREGMRGNLPAPVEPARE